MAGQDSDAPMRDMPIAKSILLSIVTLSIYYWIQSWRNSNDIQNARADGFGWWKVMFVLGFFTFGVTFIVLYVLNFIQVGKMRAEAGGDNTLGIVALVLTLVTGIVGPIVWAIHWNNTIETGAGAGTTTTATATS